MAKIKIGRRVMFWICYAVLLSAILLSPELLARALAKINPKVSNGYSYTDLAKQYPLREQLMSDWGALHFEYHDYYLYSPRHALSKTVNFTNFWGARFTPASIDIHHAKEIIWAFGGSTMQNLEADDELSMANQIVVELNRANVPTALYNFGTGGFQSSLESIKFQVLLRNVSLEERPTSVIFYDGFNDSLFAYLYGAGRLQANTSGKLRDLIERNYLRISISSLSEWLGSKSVFWDDYINRRVQLALHSSAPPNSSESNLKKAVSTYISNVRMIKGICEEFNIRCLFFLQPLIITKTPLSHLEAEVVNSLGQEKVQFGKQFYKEVSLALEGEPSFVDLSRILDGINDSYFFDYGHTSPYAGIAIGKAIARKLLVKRDLNAKLLSKSVSQIRECDQRVARTQRDPENLAFELK